MASRQADFASTDTLEASLLQLQSEVIDMATKLSKGDQGVDDDIVGCQQYADDHGAQSTCTLPENADWDPRQYHKNCPCYMRRAAGGCTKYSVALDITLWLMIQLLSLPSWMPTYMPLIVVVKREILLNFIDMYIRCQHHLQQRRVLWMLKSTRSMIQLKSTPDVLGNAEYEQLFQGSITALDNFDSGPFVHEGINVMTIRRTFTLSNDDNESTDMLATFIRRITTLMREEGGDDSNNDDDEDFTIDLNYNDVPKCFVADIRVSPR